MAVSAGAVVVPGACLGDAAALRAGPGAYERDGSVFAALVGHVRLAAPTARAAEDGATPASPASSPARDSDSGDAKPSASAGDARQIVSVVAAAARQRIVPVVGSTITCRVTKVNPRTAFCDILCVGSKSIPGVGFKGSIRKENVRSFEVDRVDMHASFRPGDIVRAVVASLGSARSYELSTAETHLGVVSALGISSSEPLVAVSHDTMRCPATGQLEPRKVAKLD